MSEAHETHDPLNALNAVTTPEARKASDAVQTPESLLTIRDLSGVFDGAVAVAGRFSDAS